MAFTPTQKSTLCKILGINAIALDVQLGAYADDITPEMEADVIAEIARWTSGEGINSVWFEGTESNEGFNQSGNIKGGSPKQNIETLLFFQPIQSGTQFEMIRG